MEYHYVCKWKCLPTLLREILEEKAISVRGQQVKTIGVPGVFYSEESSEQKTVNIKITIEMLLSSVIDTFKFKHLKERESFWRKLERFNAKFND